MGSVPATTADTAPPSLPRSTVETPLTVPAADRKHAAVRESGYFVTLRVQVGSKYFFKPTPHVLVCVAQIVIGLHYVRGLRYSRSVSLTNGPEA